MATAYTDNVKAAVWVAPVLGGDSLMLLGGALRLHHNLPWMGLSDPKFGQVDWRSLYRYLPLKDALDSAGIESPLWKSICTEWEKTWKENDLRQDFAAIDVPGLHFGGFWDFMLDASMFGYEAHARPGRRPQALVLGPWSHNAMAAEITRNGYVDYGPEASSGFLRKLTAWFDLHLKGRGTGSCAGVEAYVPGAGWLRSPAWPFECGKDWHLYLGNGVLEEHPGGEGTMEYVYDPSDPVPTQGGALWEFPRAGLDPGPAPVTTGNRDDVLVFQGRELPGPVTALGPALVELVAGTDAPSTDFTAKIVDVDPVGTPRIVADAIRRLSPVDVAGNDGAVSISLGVVGHVFEKGHRIRLDISSSNFPKFDRNLNTGISGLLSSQMRTARQVVRFGGAGPSRLTLRVLEGASRAIPNLRIYLMAGKQGGAAADAATTPAGG